MKLGTKIFFCVTIFFSVVFLIGGYTLLAYFYEISMEREVENAAEQYQYNKFVLQAALITRGREWFDDMANGKYDVSIVAADMNHSVAVYKADGTKLYSQFSGELDVSDMLAQAAMNRVNYQCYDIMGRAHILIAGMVAQEDIRMYLITAVDVEHVRSQQQRMIEKFGMIYACAIGISTVLICGLSFLLSRPIKRLARATRSIADGNYGERIAIAGEDEVGQLARDFNQMALAVEVKMQELSDNARQKEDFVQNFAHELKTPLTSIIGYANRIYQRDLPRDEQKQEALYIWNEGMRLESLSHKLMDLTNLDKGEFALQEMQADMLLQELVGDVAYLVQERHAAIHLKADDAILLVEYDLFKTLFLNLIDNSLKAGADCIRVTGTIERDGPKRQYLLQIADNGRGIPAQELQRITEAFYMVDKSRSRKQHGAGLGLSLAEKIADIHGSSLVFESDGESGATVSMRFDCKENE